ncbi:ERF family protein [Acidovorax sp. Root219]|uniref:ERF family protein n=1 Tax=Acidovorax sp. Root219 TaxID=1736493 RepID=UPI00070EDA2F|nr:ERF family protein [Acidovorax sp. Root219]KRC36267.1 hypothetical protein ASE28_01675 [Acidovorax sp. Root219]
MTTTELADTPTQAQTVAPEALPAPTTMGAIATTSPAGLMLHLLREHGNLDQFERMMDMQERWERREAEKAFNDALTAFKALNIKIPKRKLVDFETRGGGRTQYKHAELDDVTDLLGPALSAHGLSWSWRPKQENGMITITCVLRHRLGHCEEVSLSSPPDASGGKNAIQAVISTTTYLERHTLKAITGTAESGEDDDGQGAPDGTGAESLATVWCNKVIATKTRAELTQVMKEGRVVFKDAKDRDGYAAFAHAIETHGAALPAEG